MNRLTTDPQKKGITGLTSDGFYNISDLEDINRNYAYPITPREVRKVNSLIGLIRKAREQDGPTEGDSVEFISRTGDYFGEAHIEKIIGKHSHICLSPEMPFCFMDRKKAAFETEGSPWTQISTSLLVPAGSTMKELYTWGYGRRHHKGYIHFRTSVRKWKFREADPLYDGYTTRDWHKYHIMKHRDPERRNEYTYRSDDFTLYSRNGLDNLVEILHGKLYKGIFPNSLVLWGYRMELKEISRKEWNGMGGQGKVLMDFLDYGPVRILADDKHHTVTIYRINDHT
ncbi:DUF4121 family protein [Bacteroides stercoris]|uniref:DUF4121 family protein n=1 Tax=Bacteroides stercoris TaxID=46506 RepID=UPI00321B4569